MSNKELLGDLDMDMDIDEMEMSPEFVDMSLGTYVLRIAGMTQKDIELEGDDDDVVQGTRLNIIFQIVGIVAAEMPAPEVGGIFSYGGIMQFQIARDQLVRVTKKAVKLANPDFFSQKRNLGEIFQEMIALYDENNLLECNITLRDEKYPQIRTMKRVGPESVEGLDWSNFSKASFEWTP